MKAMRAHQFGGPEQLRLEDAPDPQAQAGQVVARLLELIPLTWSAYQAACSLRHFPISPYPRKTFADR
jgi:NADPH:quinone reductase-like Zn-dependent oxidoreductase